jgi:myo-inositol 2-dehydrogenase / D-chiro-inositol 1-dehydrogenase
VAEGQAPRAAVVGLNWGRVHIHALRQAGAQVVAVVDGGTGRADTVAREDSVPMAFAGLEPLLQALHENKLTLDMVCICTPPASHADVASRLRVAAPGLALLCEKPLMGLAFDAARVADFGPRCWVNYAFPFLELAQRLAQAMHDEGPPRQVQVRTTHDLPHAFDGVQGFLELGGHPWAWVVQCLGLPQALRREGQALHGQAGPTELQWHCEARPGLEGMTHEVSVMGARHHWRLSGAFRRGRPWHFSLARHGERIADSSGTDGDPWLQANARAIAQALAAAVSAWRGAGPADPRLTSAAQAATIEKQVLAAWGPGP